MTQQQDETVYFNDTPVFRYKQWDVTISLSHYADPLQRTAIQLRAADTEHNEAQDVMPGEPIAVATVNLPEWEARADQTYIKDWSENEGMAQWLYGNGLATPTGTFVEVGYVDAPLVNLTDKLFDIAGRL